MTLAGHLESAYRRLNRRALIEPDPLQLVHEFRADEDREIVGLIAACLAYGRVAHILKSARAILDRLGPHPSAFVRDADARELRGAVRGLQHRWTTADDLADLLAAARRAMARSGSLGGDFKRHWRGDEETIWPTLARWTAQFEGGRLVPDANKGSAAKRMHLFLRWMIRRDEVDVGVWPGRPTSQLMVPLDVHMHRVARALRLTRRNIADQKAAIEITRAFRRINPEDPVRYDFALTRFGIRDGWDERRTMRELRSWNSGATR